MAVQSAKRPWQLSTLQDLQVPRHIDHHLTTPSIESLARRESIDLAQRFSEHAPLTIDHDFKL
jgi:exonuclease III